jgi:hypothetical protein
LFFVHKILLFEIFTPFSACFAANISKRRFLKLNSSVGCPPTGIFPGLHGPAHRYLPLPDEKIKSLDGLYRRGYSEEDHEPFFQRPIPMGLARPGQARKPSAVFGSIGYARTDFCDRGLKSAEEFPRSHSYDGLAVGTSIATQRQTDVEAVEKGLHETVAP